MTYMVKEVFYSLQGEGCRAGTPNVFVRFAGCNLACNEAEHGFDCDTDFVGGRRLTLDQLLMEMQAVADVHCDWVIFTGGEPLLQLDRRLVQAARAAGWHIAVETNGTKALDFGVDWLCVAPKLGEPLAVRKADEVKVVTPLGWPIPEGLDIDADHWLISPAFMGDEIAPETLRWCVDLCLANPPWRLSVQQHKAWGVR